MQTSGWVTLKASLLASAVGTGAWFFGLSKALWPAHPWFAVLGITMASTFAFVRLLQNPQV